MFTTAFDVVYHPNTVHCLPFFTPSQLSRPLYHFQETHRSIHRHLSPPSMHTPASANNYPPLQTNMLGLHTYLLPQRTQQQLKKNLHTNTRTPPKPPQLHKDDDMFSTPLTSPPTSKNFSPFLFFIPLLLQASPTRYLNSLREMW